MNRHHEGATAPYGADVDPTRDGSTVQGASFVMSHPRNFRIERHYYEKFRLLPEAPEGDVCYGDKPDVCVFGGRVIGVEVANLYLRSGYDPTSEQQQRARRAEVVARARKLFESKGGRGISVSFCFSTEHPITNVRRLANDLAVFLAVIPEGCRGSLDPCAFAHIRELRWAFYNPVEYPVPRWDVTQVYDVPGLSTARVREAVESKARKLSGYRYCDAYWLLLVVDMMDPSQDQELVWPEGALLGRTPFEKVLLYSPQEARVCAVPQIG